MVVKKTISFFEKMHLFSCSLFTNRWTVRLVIIESIGIDFKTASTNCLDVSPSDLDNLSIIIFSNAIAIISRSFSRAKKANVN